MPDFSGRHVERERKGRGEEEEGERTVVSQTISTSFQSHITLHDGITPDQTRENLRMKLVCVHVCCSLPENEDRRRRGEESVDCCALHA